MQCAELRILLVVAENVIAELYNEVLTKKGFRCESCNIIC